MKKINVYVYSGLGASPKSTQLLMSSLKRCLDPQYNVTSISPEQIKQGDWTETCAAVFFGGGYDLGFLQSLGDEGADRIVKFVESGGAYFGFCAGAYFACDHIQFEKGSAELEVCGHRPLRFYPGQCIGSIAPGFTYNSEKGAAAFTIKVQDGQFPDATFKSSFSVYINGGGSFTPYNTLHQFPHIQQVETLAVFEDVPMKLAAVVKSTIGDQQGTAILSGVHVEFSATELDFSDEYLSKIQERLWDCDKDRELFFKALLQEARMKVKVDSLL